MAESNYPTKQELEECFELRDGNLWRKAHVGVSGYRCKEKLVVNKVNHNEGYCRAGFKDRLVFYHNIVYILTNGGIPEGCIVDHIDGNKLNNSIGNLRAVNHRENQQNRHNHRTGKLVGCSFDESMNKCRALIRINKKLIHLGLYDTEQEAHDVYTNAVDLIESYNGDNDEFRRAIGA